MSRGYPDWFEPVPKREVIVRPDLYYNYGKAIFFDNVEAANKKFEATGNLPAGTTLSTAYSNKGEASIKMTTAAVIGSSTGAKYTLPMPASQKIGIQIALSLPATRAQTSEIYLWLYGAGGTLKAQMRFDTVADTMQYYDSGGNWVDWGAGTPKFYATAVQFNRWKYTIDLSTNKYIDAFYNQLHADLRAQSLYNAGGAEQERIEVRIWHTAQTASARTQYVDDVVVTEE